MELPGYGQRILERELRDCRSQRGEDGEENGEKSLCTHKWLYDDHETAEVICLGCGHVLDKIYGDTVHTPLDSGPRGPGGRGDNTGSGGKGRLYKRKVAANFNWPALPSSATKIPAVGQTSKTAGASTDFEMADQGWQQQSFSNEKLGSGRRYYSSYRKARINQRKTEDFGDELVDNVLREFNDESADPLNGDGCDTIGNAYHGRREKEEGGNEAEDGFVPPYLGGSDIMDDEDRCSTFSELEDEEKAGVENRGSQQMERIRRILDVYHLDNVSVRSEAVKLFNKIYGDIKPGNGFRKSYYKESVAIAFAIINTLTKQGCPRPPAFFTNLCAIDSGDLLDLPKTLGLSRKMMAKLDARDYELRDISPRDYVSTAARLFQLDPTTTGRMLERVGVYTSQYPGKQPNTIAAAAMQDVLMRSRPTAWPRCENKLCSPLSCCHGWAKTKDMIRKQLDVGQRSINALLNIDLAEKLLPPADQPSLADGLRQQQQSRLICRGSNIYGMIHL